MLAMLQKYEESQRQSVSMTMAEKSEAGGLREEQDTLTMSSHYLQNWLT